MQPPGAAIGAAPPGPITKTGGILSYMEICMKLKEGGWTEVCLKLMTMRYARQSSLFVCLFVLMQVGLWMEKGPLDYSLSRNYIYPAGSNEGMLSNKHFFSTSAITTPITSCNIWCLICSWQRVIQKKILKVIKYFHDISGITVPACKFSARLIRIFPKCQTLATTAPFPKLQGHSHFLVVISCPIKVLLCPCSSRKGNSCRQCRHQVCTNNTT